MLMEMSAHHTAFAGEGHLDSGMLRPGIRYLYLQYSVAGWKGMELQCFWKDLSVNGFSSSKCHTSFAS